MKKILSLSLALLVLENSNLFAAEREVPFEVTEQRERCDHFDRLKQPFFGELHLHTSYSMDAANIDTRLTPRDAYRYAKGEAVGLPPWQDTRIGQPAKPPSTESIVTSHPYCMPGEECEFMATRAVQKGPGRALDFAAITDHAEQFGETNICFFEPTQRCGDAGGCTVEGQICDGPFPHLAFSDPYCVPAGYTSSMCNAAREELSRLRLGSLPNEIALVNNSIANPFRFPQICKPESGLLPPWDSEGGSCELNAKHVWDQIGNDAEEAYDRTSTCSFTSFHAYEYTAMALSGRCEEEGDDSDGSSNENENGLTSTSLPCWSDSDCPTGTCTTKTVNETFGGFDNLHRNIIFRNSTTIDKPISNVEQPTGCGDGYRCLPRNRGTVSSPVNMLEKLAMECEQAEPGRDGNCEFISIPHNSNWSGGSMFVPETLNSREATVRNLYEPLVELMQIKGQSECRYSEKTGIWWGIGSDEVDPLCDFENTSFTRLGGYYLKGDDANTVNIPPRSYVRNTLQSGIQYSATTGDPNPFKLGFVGGLDNHSGLPGQTNESVYAKNGGHGIVSFAVSGQALDETNFLGLETNAGGLTVAWAEENSRDSIFHALRNRETYATSGTRPIVRFFGGFRLPENICDKGNFARNGYRKGTPMGGTLDRPDPTSKKKSPTFAVSALWDAGWGGRAGTPLQRLQIIKGWVDRDGNTHEKVIDHDQFQRGEPGSADAFPPSADSCEPSSRGYTNLCAVWTDPDFDVEENAFYYARVLEQPSCRWNKFYCDARAVDCREPMGTCRAASMSDPGDGQGCMTQDECSGDAICQLPNSYTEWEYNQCCAGIVPDYVQQRAWTSPIWYSP